MNRFLHEELGFTIQELLVVIVVGSLLVSFGYSLLLFAHKSDIAWQRKSEAEGSVAHILNLITLDVLQSKDVDEVSDTALILTRKSDVKIRYRFDGKRVYRNNDPVSPAENTAFSVAVTEDVSEKDSRDLIVHIKVAAATMNSTFSDSTEVMVPWSSRSAFLSRVQP